MNPSLFSRGSFWGVFFVLLLLSVAAASCAGKQNQAKSPLDIILESSRPTPSSLPGVMPGERALLSTEAGSDDIPPEVLEALSEILLEAEDESAHPLPFYFLPQSESGMVDWVAAIDLGVITPMDRLGPIREELPPLDFDVVFKVKGSLPDVVYPHYPHTLWLDCKNCHPGIFVMQAGVNKVTMDGIAKGEFCGRCHGKVAFPLNECNRCHSRPKPGKFMIIPRVLG